LAVSQFFDFGVLLPANYLTMAILIGALLGHADQQLHRTRQRIRVRIPRGSAAGDHTHTEATRERRHADRSRRRERSASSSLFSPVLRIFSHQWLPPVLAVLLFAYLWMIISDARGRAEVDLWQRTAAQLQAGGPNITLAVDPRVNELAADRPTDTDAQLTAAAWQLLLFRSNAVRATNDNTNALATTSSEAWRNSRQTVIRAVAHTTTAADRQRMLSSIIRPNDLAGLQNARKSAVAALLASPLDVAARELLIRLDYLDRSSPPEAAETSKRLFEQIGQLRSRHSPTLHEAAKLAYIHPGKETAFSLWQRAFAINPEFLDMYWRDAEGLVDEATFTRAIPNDPYLAQRFAVLAKQPQVRLQMLDRAEQLLLSEKPAPENVAKHHYSLARVADMKRDFRAAEEHYAQAIAGNQTATDWRYLYVLVLEKNGRKREALDQIERCLLQDPNNTSYQRTKQALTKQF
jgi:tetratricopeptide (TPR) repeat protein